LGREARLLERGGEAAGLASSASSVAARGEGRLEDGIGGGGVEAEAEARDSKFLGRGLGNWDWESGRRGEGKGGGSRKRKGNWGGEASAWQGDLLRRNRQGK
jgi:hypothetical protein